MLKLLVVFYVVLVSCTNKSPKEPIEPEDRYLSIPGDSFIVIGDSGTGTRYQREVGQAIDKYCQLNSCDFGLILGDVIYPNGIDSPADNQMQSKFEEPYKALDFVFYPSLGNHDHRGEWLAFIQYTSSRWKMPARYYKISTDLADIIAIDTEIFDETQRIWLEQELKRSTKPWKIVYGHHPIFSSGMHGDSSSMKKKLLPILKKYKADFYLAGHDHHLELIQKDGLKTIISGAAGKLRGVRPKPESIFAKSRLGFAYMSLSEDSLKLEFVDSDNVLLYAQRYKK